LKIGECVHQFTNRCLLRTVSLLGTSWLH